MQLKRWALCVLIVITLASSASALPIKWCELWGTCTPLGPPPFVPTYQTATLNDQFGHTYNLNPYYFATQSTADTVCKKVMCAYTFSQPCDMGGGGATCSVDELMCAFKDGTPPTNAGLLASYWTRNPEDRFPGLALKLVQAELDKVRPKPQAKIENPPTRAVSMIDTIRQLLAEPEDTEVDCILKLDPERRFI